MNLQDIFNKQLKDNPNLQRVMDMVGNRNPRDVFIEECKKRGIDPSTILQMLK